MSKLRFIGVAAIFVLCATSAMATNFRAADQVYVPAVIHAVGASGTFLSDVFISNLTTDTVAVSVIYCPQGITGCSGSAVQTFTNLITLAGNERKELVDWAALPQSQGGLGQTGTVFGQVVFNGCKSGVSCGADTQDANGVSPNFRNISVETRVYSIPAGTSLSSNPPTTGQLFSGFPWYNFVSQEQSANKLDKVFITGIRSTGSAGTAGTSRSNIGLVNASQFSNTTMVVKLFNGAGTQQGSEYTTQLGPLGSVQVGLGTAFPGASGSGYWVTVEQRNSTATSDAPAACAPPTSNGCPAFFAYGSVLDNASGDATTLEPQYLLALTDAQIACIYPAPSQAVCKGTPVMRRAVKK